MQDRNLSEAAAAGMIMTVKCDMCRRTVHFWASDLVQILGAHHPLSKPPWLCSKCKTADYMHVRCKVWSTNSLQGLIIRRPVRKVTRWIWRDEQA